MKKMTFKAKIMSIGLMWSGMLFVCMFTIFQSQKVLHSVQAEQEHSQKIVQSFNQLLIVMINLETGIRGYLLSGDEAYLEPFNQNEAKFEQAARITEELIKADSKQMTFLTQIKDSKQAWITGPAVEEMMARRKLQRNMLTMEQFISVFKSSQGKTLTDGVRKSVEDSISLELQRNNLIEEKRKGASKNVNIILFLGMPLSIILGLALLIISVQKVNRQIIRLLDSLKDKSLALENVSENLLNLSNQMNSSSENIAESAQKTAQATDHINKMTVQNSSLAEQSKESAKKCMSASLEGIGAVEEVLNSIQSVSNTSDEMLQVIHENNNKVSSIINLIENIREKTNVINDIVMQTRLLSFNASVEAARAGELGKGFSVVAEEVGKLANLSGVAAKEIGDLLVSSTKEVDDIAKNTIESMNRYSIEIQSKLKHSNERAHISSELISKMKFNVASVEGITENICQSSNEQSLGLKEVNKAIQDIDHVTSEQTHKSQKCFEIAEQLKQHSSELTIQTQLLNQMFGSKQKEAS